MIGPVLGELHRAEQSLGRDLLTLSDVHEAEHEIHYVAGDLAAWCGEHVASLAAIAKRYDLSLEDAIPAAVDSSGHEPPDDLSGMWREPGLRLLADLRHVHRQAAGVSLDWELLAQGAQALKDTELVQLTQRFHPQTLRQMNWTNAMLKTLSPQILASRQG
jgi:hypothetical protein